jgi:hypothetical protein
MNTEENIENQNQTIGEIGEIGEINDTEVEATTPNFDKVEQYYVLKNSYYENKKTHKNRALLSVKESNSTNWKLKQAALSKNKPKCVNCKRPVGSIFITTPNSDKNTRSLIAKCGDAVNPCKLNIELTLNPVGLLDEKLNKDRKSLVNNQDKIIKTKNDLLFGYLPQEEALNFFESIKNDIESDTVNVELKLFKFLNVTHNTENVEKIKQLKTEFYQNIKEFKEFINNFEKTNEIEHINNANDYYMHTILPTIKELTDLKYSYMNVDHDIDNNVKTLVQKPYTISMIEDSDNKEMVEVVHFSTGLNNPEIDQSATRVDEEIDFEIAEPTQKKTKQPRKTKPTLIQETVKQGTVKQTPTLNLETQTRKNRKTAAPRLVIPEENNANLFQAINHIRSSVPKEEFGTMNIRDLIARLESDYGFSNLLNTHTKIIKDYLMKSPEI